MNKHKFIEFLQNPGKLNAQNLRELDDLVGENPYFQAARVLEAKGNRLLKTKEAGKKTASAAIYSTNRLLLKKYLGDGLKQHTGTASRPQSVQEQPKPQEAPPRTAPTQISVTQATPPPTHESEGPDSTSSIDQLIYSLKQDMKELAVSRTRYIEFTRKLEEEEAVENAVKKATKSTEASTASKESTAQKPAAKSPEKKVAKKTAPKKATTASKAKSTTATKSTRAKKTTAASKSIKTKTTTKAAPKKTASKKTTRTTASKTKATTKKSPAPKKTATKPKATKSTATKTTAKKTTARASRGPKSQKTTKKDDSDGENQQDLINEFIKKNPSFKPATQTKNPEDLSSESTVLNDDLVSEYLAEIFLEQGKKDSAIKIYNSLMLRFPEKKAYFAGRIKKIK